MADLRDARRVITCSLSARCPLPVLVHERVVPAIPGCFGAHVHAGPGHTMQNHVPGQPKPGGMPEDLDLDNFLDSYLVQLQSDMTTGQQLVQPLTVGGWPTSHSMPAAAQSRGGASARAFTTRDACTTTDETDGWTDARPSVFATAAQVMQQPMGGMSAGMPAQLQAMQGAGVMAGHPEAALLGMPHPTGGAAGLNMAALQQGQMPGQLLNPYLGLQQQQQQSAPPMGMQPGMHGGNMAVGERPGACRAQPENLTDVTVRTSPEYLPPRPAAFQRGSSPPAAAAAAAATGCCRPFARPAHPPVTPVCRRRLSHADADGNDGGERSFLATSHGSFPAAG